MMDIDWHFLSRFEGGQWLDVYFPPGPYTEKSGPTVATGVDLGSRNAGNLMALKLPAALIAKLTPYLGQKGLAAAEFVRQNPCRITAEEADLLDRAVKQQTFDRLRRRYDAAVADTLTPQCFDDLAPEVQTVICSVAWQYGSNLPQVTSKFWRDITAQDWSAACDRLMDFEDKYPTRRQAEAAYLRNWIDRQAM
jgi:hypothetical protein